LEPKQGPIIEIPMDLAQFTAYNAITPSLSNVVELARPFTFEASMGTQVATHQGAHYYTIGQRKGLHIGGRPEPSFVLTTDTEKNIIYSGQTDEHPGLYRRALKLAANDINWIQPMDAEALKTGVQCSIRIRYRQALQQGTLIEIEGILYILFERPQRGITPGQFAAWYINDELIGSGVIAE